MLSVEWRTIRTLRLSFNVFQRSHISHNLSPNQPKRDVCDKCSHLLASDSLSPPLYVKLPMKPLVNLEVARLVLRRQVTMANQKVDQDLLQLSARSSERETRRTERAVWLEFPGAHTRDDLVDRHKLCPHHHASPDSQTICRLTLKNSTSPSIGARRTSPGSTRISYTYWTSGCNHPAVVWR